MTKKQPIYVNKIDELMKKNKMKPSHVLEKIEKKYPKTPISYNTLYRIRTHVKNPSLHEIVQICWMFGLVDSGEFHQVFNSEMCRIDREKSS